MKTFDLIWLYNNQKSSWNMNLGMDRGVYSMVFITYNKVFEQAQK